MITFIIVPGAVAHATRPRPARSCAREMWREQRFIDTVFFNYLDGLLQNEEGSFQAATSVFRQRFLVTARLALAFVFVRLALLGFPGKMQFLRIMSLTMSCRLPRGRQLPRHFQMCRPPGARAHLPNA